MRTQSRTPLTQLQQETKFEECDSRPITSDSILMEAHNQQRTVNSPASRQVLGRLPAKENDQVEVEPIPSSTVTSSSDCYVHKNSNDHNQESYSPYTIQSDQMERKGMIHKEWHPVRQRPQVKVGKHAVQTGTRVTPSIV